MDFFSVVNPPAVSTTSTQPVTAVNTASTQPATTQTTDPCCMNPIPPGINCFAPCMTTTASQTVDPTTTRVKLPPCSSFPRNPPLGTRIGIVCDPNA